MDRSATMAPIDAGIQRSIVGVPRQPLPPDQRKPPASRAKKATRKGGDVASVRRPELEPSAVLGKALANIRDNAGLRQQDVAEEAQSLGLEWSRATVAAVETGRRSLSANELILLPYVLSMVCMTPMSLGDLFLTASADVRLADQVVVPCGLVQSFLDGERARELIWATSDDGEPTEMERRLAARLGVAVERLVTLSVELWGKRFDVVREERAEAAARAQGEPPTTQTLSRLRSHFSKALVDELEITLQSR